MEHRIAIAGAAGRMGRQLLEAAMEGGWTLAGGTERADAAGDDLGRLIGRDPVGQMTTSDPAHAARAADAWVDFTAPGATLAALKALEDSPVKAVIIGTTGFSAAEEDQIGAHAGRFAIVKAGNFSLGVQMLMALVKRAAGALPGETWDIEISEAHHRHKVDAPSGTALMLGEAAAAGRGARLENLRRAPDDGQTGPRPEGSIGFSVQRGGGIFGEHEVMFAAARETLRLSHTALDRRVFADGALHAAAWALKQPPGLFGMEDVIGL
jgi:4-hydroxy-tetrahydrodipicolinate reductase